MKENILITVSLLLIISGANAQSCLPDGIEFTSQSQIDNFSTNYPGCTEIEGNVLISGSDITNLGGLNVLYFIGGDLEIQANESLASFAGLEHMTSISGGLNINDNEILANLSGLDNLISIGDYLFIGFNNVLSSVSGLENLKSIGGNITFMYNFNLTSIADLMNLTYLGGNLWIYGNYLTSLSGLENLDTIGGKLIIELNNSLVSLTALENLSIIGSGLRIESNFMLFDLTGLDQVTSVGGNLEILSNSSLKKLTGLQNINEASITDLRITDNISLSTCNIISICDYLASPNGTIEIYGNETGCNSQEEVEEACLNGLEEEEVSENKWSIYPNPGKGIVDCRWSMVDGRWVTAKIFDMQGREVETIMDKRMPAGKQVVTFDVSHLPKGVYLVRMSDEITVRAVKFLVE